MKELIAIQAELKVPKNQTNKFGGYNYRSAEDITEAAKPLLEKHHCFLNMEDRIEQRGQAFVCKDYYDFGYEDKDGIWHPDLREIQTVKGLRYFLVATATITNSAGEKVSCSAEAEHPEFKKGMDPAQVSGATSSYARKYALGGLFALDDIRDPDATNDHGRQEPRRHGPGRQQTPPPVKQSAPAPQQNTASAQNPAPKDKPAQTTLEKQLALMARLNFTTKDVENALGKPFEQLDEKDNAFLRAVIKIMIQQKIGFEDAVEQQCRIEADNHPEAAQ